MIVSVLKDCEIQTYHLNDVFSALIEYGLLHLDISIAVSFNVISHVACCAAWYSSLAELDVWYLHATETRGSLLASWERFLSVCRIIILTMYDRID